MVVSSRIWLVADPEGELEEKGALERFQDPLRRQLAFWVRDGADYSYDCIALDLLRALGKARDNSGRASQAQRRFDQACAWLIGHGTRDLLAASAHLLTRRSLSALIEATLTARARLWLAAIPGAPKRFNTLLNDWPHRRCSIEFLRSQLDHHRSAPVPSNSARLPVALDTPHDEFPTFVATVRRLLVTPDARSAFERLYNSACRRTVAGHRALGTERPQ